MIEVRTLKSGIRVIMEKIPYVQSVSVGIMVRAGSVDETAEISGISHYIEHMLFKGTENRSAKQIASDVDKIGGQINAFTGKEATCYYIKTLSTNLEPAAEILLDMLLNSEFNEEEMEKEKSVIYEEMKMIQDSPDDDAHDTVCELLFQGNPLGRSIIGTQDSLKGIERKDIKEYIRKEYTRDHMVVAIAGNFDEDHVCSLFEGKLDVLEARKPEKEFGEVPYQPRYRTKVKDIEQSHLCLAAPGVALEDDRYYAMSLLSNIMGGTMSSRLFQNIREEKGLAYSVYSMATSFSQKGYFNIYAGVSHDKVAAAVKGIKEELGVLKRDSVTAEELDTAKEQMKSAYIFGQENVNGRMFSIGKNLVISGKVYTPEEVVEKYNQVTMDDIREVSELVCDLEVYCGVAITNRDLDMKAIIEA